MYQKNNSNSDTEKLLSYYGIAVILYLEDIYRGDAGMFALGFEDKLLNNIIDFRRLESEALPPGFSKDGLMAYLRQRTQTNARIMRDNVSIIDKYISPFIKNPENASIEEIDCFFALAQKLFNLSESLDIGLALEIHKALIEWAQAKNDIDRQIRSLYFAGVIYQQLNLTMVLGNGNLMMFLQKGLDCFMLGAAFKSKYFEIKSKETRMYINRCIGNIYVMRIASRHAYAGRTAQAFFAAVDTAMDFWNNEEVRKKDPDFPWEAFEINAHYNICTWVDILRAQPVKERNEYLVKRVCASFNALIDIDGGKSKNRFWSPKRTEYSRLIVSYYEDKLTFEELLARLRVLCNEAEISDYSSDGAYGMIDLQIILIHHLESYGNENDISNSQEIGTIIKRIINYIKHMPSGASRVNINKSLALCAKEIGKFVDFDNYTDLLLQMTSYSHFWTYVHSVQVKKMTGLLANYFMDTAPQLFLGILDAKNTEEVLAKRREIIDLTCTAALCHDIGKVSYLDVFSLSCRKLYGHEFDIIKQHTNAVNFFKTGSDKMHFIADVVKGHHQWHNGKQGYLTDVNISHEHKFIAEMVSVTDSMDAATDTVGRSYSKGVDFHTVVEEIHTQEGERYSPIISQALKDDAELFESMRKCAVEERETTYYEAYCKLH